jgi:NhaP-type Na+/H+ or K+/H+ antiporter
VHVTLSSEQIAVGVGLTLALAVGCQLAASRLRIPAIVILLPVGFAAGALSPTMNPENLVGTAFTPLVGLGVAVILFDGGLDLVFRDLEGHSQRVVRRLLSWGVLLTWALAGLFAWVLLDLSVRVAIMLGAILIVSGPTVVNPLVALAKPGRQLKTILEWEATTVDPIGAIIGALVFEALRSGVLSHLDRDLAAFLLSVGTGVLFGALGVVILWLLLKVMKVDGPLATEAIMATVVALAALSDALRADTGLIAAIIMGVALANLPGIPLVQHRPFFGTLVQLVIGLLFISISATVTPASLQHLVLPSLGLVALLVLVVRPLVAATATVNTTLSGKERVFLGALDPRGIVAASTAATFGLPLAAAGLGGAGDILPVTFLVVAGTVTVYGLGAVPLARWLGLRNIDQSAVGPDAPSIEPPSIAE